MNIDVGQVNIDIGQVNIDGGRVDIWKSVMHFFCFLPYYVSKTSRDHDSLGSVWNWNFYYRL